MIRVHPYLERCGQKWGALVVITTPTKPYGTVKEERKTYSSFSSLKALMAIVGLDEETRLALVEKQRGFLAMLGVDGDSSKQD